MDSYFNDDGKKPLSISQETQQVSESLASEKDIAIEVHKEVVGTAVIKEDDTIKFPMICIKADKVTSIPSFALDGLRALIRSCQIDINDFDDTLPVYIATPSKILKLGEGSFAKLYRYVDGYVKSSINPSIKVFHFTSPKVKERIDKVDASKIRLEI